MTTKLGLISDVHGDIYSLERALDILGEEGADRVVCCGDLVDRGYSGDEVVALFGEREIPCVLGNHDADIINPPDYWTWPRKPYEQVSEESLYYLMDLPEELLLEIDGKTVMVTHGAPGDDSYYLYPSSNALDFHWLLDEAWADILINGHTHTPLSAEVVDTGWIFNPGSVLQQSSRDSGTCAILTLPTCDYTVYSISSRQPVEVTHRVIR